MSCRPTIGGKLRKNFRSRQVTGCIVCWGLDPVKEIGQTCGLNVILRHTATSNRSVVDRRKVSLLDLEDQPTRRERWKSQ
jgi:hypothetical protein